MKMIIELIDLMDEELDHSQTYAEKYIQAKIENDINYDRYIAMAKDEIRHADFLYQIALEKYNTLKERYALPERIKNIWKNHNKEFAEKKKSVNDILNM